MTAADQAQTFRRVVRTIAYRNGLCADFSPKPLADAPGNGLHINLSVDPFDKTVFSHMIAGILTHVREMTLFLNPSADSYLRLGTNKAPGFVSWSCQNRSQLIRIPAAEGIYRRAELRSPDPGANPYLAFLLLIRAGLDGIERELVLPPAADFNFYTADPGTLAAYDRLPESYEEALDAALASDFIRETISGQIRSVYSR